MRVSGSCGDSDFEKSHLGNGYFIKSYLYAGFADVIVAGAGLAGLVAAARARELAVDALARSASDSDGD